MKRVGYLYEKLCDVDFIKKAIKNAAKGKTDRLYVKAILTEVISKMANAKQKVFSKDKWLETANADKAAGILTQREIDDACEIWVNDLDGKSKEEIADNNGASLRDEWFVEA